MPPPLVPKLKVPIEMGRNGLRAVEQGSIDEIAQCAYAVLATPVGSRLEDPDLGVEDPTFENFPLDLSSWTDALAIAEPRALADPTQEIEEGVVNVAEEVRRA